MHRKGFRAWKILYRWITGEMSHESQFTLGPDKKELLSEGVYSDKFMCCLCGDMATCAAQPQPQFAFAVTTGLVYNWTMFTLLCLVLVGHLSNGYVKVFNHPNWFQMASNVTKSQICQKSFFTWALEVDAWRVHACQLLAQLFLTHMFQIRIIKKALKKAINCYCS